MGERKIRRETWVEERKIERESETERGRERERERERGKREKITNTKKFM